MTLTGLRGGTNEIYLLGSDGRFYNTATEWVPGYEAHVEWLLLREKIIPQSLVSMSTPADDVDYHAELRRLMAVIKRQRKRRRYRANKKRKRQQLVGKEIE